MVFRDRRDAGRRLGARLVSMEVDDAVVLGLPRGGIPVAEEVARAVHAPLDVLVARKLGVPGQRELGFGAIAEGGVVALNHELVERLGIGPRELDAVVAEESVELERRVRLYRRGEPPEPLAGRTAVLVDDGLATGYTARAGLAALEKLGAGRIILAIPVGAPESIGAIEMEGYEVVCLEAPEYMMAVGQWYEDFAQTSDAEVADVMARSSDVATEVASGAASDIRIVGASDANPDDRSGHDRGSGVTERDVSIASGGVELPGILALPAGAAAVVVFVHGSGSSRMSPRNMAVARELNDAGLGTFLFDLLTPSEADDRANVFDIGLLAVRLEAVTARLGDLSETAGMSIAYFGASTGAAAALVAAAHLGPDVSAVVSRGGRPDLAGDALAGVTAPTLLIVGGADREVLELNHRAAAQMRCEVELVVVPGASHLFEEPGALEEVSRLAASWFLRRLQVGLAGG